MFKEAIRILADYAENCNIYVWLDQQAGVKKAISLLLEAEKELPEAILSDKNSIIVEDNMVHIPIETATTPIDGSVVMANRYWREIKPGYISVYVGSSKPDIHGLYSTYSPQCNSSEHIASSRGKYPTVFLPVVFFQDMQSS